MKNVLPLQFRSPFSLEVRKNMRAFRSTVSFVLLWGTMSYAYSQGQEANRPTASFPGGTRDQASTHGSSISDGKSFRAAQGQIVPPRRRHGTNTSPLVGKISTPASPFGQGEFWQAQSGLYGGTVSNIKAAPSGVMFAIVENTTWRSTDHGVTWTPVLGVPQFSHNFTVSGDGSIYIVGTGISHSTDDFVSSTTKATPAEAYCLTIGPGGIFYLGISRYESNGPLIYSSTDEGTSWTSISAGLPTLGIGVTGILCLSSDTLLAAVNGSGMYRSTDAGATWNPANAGLTSTNLFDIIVNGQGDFLVATFGEYMYKSSNRGASWTHVTSGLTNNQITRLSKNAGGELFASSFGGGVYRSTNNGDSWTVSNSGLLTPAIQCIAVDGDGRIFAGSYLFGIFRSVDGGDSWALSTKGIDLVYPVMKILSAPNGHLFAGTEGSGAFRSTDGGASWAPPTGNINIFVEDLALGGDGVLYAATGFFVFRSTNEGDTWVNVGSGITDPELYAILADKFGNLLVTTYSNGTLFRSTNGGDTWTGIAGGFGSAYVMGQNRNDGTLFVSADSGLFRSTDHGGTWSRAENGTGIHGVHSNVFLCTPNGTMFAGGSSIYRSTSSGIRWEQVDSGTYRGWMVANQREFIYGESGGLTASFDSGSSWTPISDSHADTLASGLSIDTAGYLLTANGRQIYKSTHSTLETPTLLIRVSAGLHGSISPGDSAAVLLGHNQSFSITPDHGYYILDVQVDNSSVGAVAAYTFTNVVVNHTISASFVPLQSFTITATAGSHGVISPSGSVPVIIGDNQTFTVSPDSGYYMDNVTVDGWHVDSTTNYTFINVASDHTIGATFAPLTISASAGPNGSVSPSGEVTLRYGSDTTFRFTPDPGYLVDSIFIDGGYSGNDSLFHFSRVVLTHVVYVTFRINPANQAEYRTASMQEWGMATDSKGKLKAEKCKPYKDEFKFDLPPVTGFGNRLALEFSMNVAGNIAVDGNHDKIVAVLSPPGKKFTLTFDTVFNPGTILRVSGTGYKSKPVVVKYSINEGPKSTVTTYLENLPRLQMPNLHNTGPELELQGDFPMTVGAGAGPKSVLLKKYKDAQKSLNDGKGILHTGDAACFSDEAFFKKQIKGLSPKKKNNKLFAEALTLKLNLAASKEWMFPHGLGNLIYHNPGMRYDGWTIDSISAFSDTVLACRDIHAYDPGMEIYSVMVSIDTAFHGAIDTMSWSCSNLRFTGTKRLYDVPYLRANLNSIPPRVKLKTMALQNVPDRFMLHQNYPNPFNPTTNISFELPNPAIVTVKVFNMLGQEVATLIDHGEFDEGEQEVGFNANWLASGIYFYRLTAEQIPDPENDISGSSFVSVKKMVLLK